MKRILFRADAKPSIGTGDLMSFIRLADHFRLRGWECHFLVKRHNAAVNILTANRVDNAVYLAPDLPEAEEVAMINALCAARDIPAVFVQITEHPMHAYTGVDSSLFRAAVMFDPGAPQGWDLVLDWDVEAERHYPDRMPGTKLFLGPEFVILPKDFLAGGAARTCRQDRKRLLVLMGGADEHDLTAEVAKRLMALKCKLSVRFVVGGGYAGLDGLRRLLENSGLDWEIARNLPAMLPEYLGCDVAIAAGGLTASELVVTRTPALLVAACEHQVNRCRYFDRMGWAKYLGSRDDWSLSIDELLGFSPAASTPFRPRITEVVNWMDCAVLHSRSKRS